MSTTMSLTPQTVLSAVEYAQYAHQEAHRGAMRVQALPAYVPGCRQCLALARAVQEARSLAELVPPTASVVPHPSSPATEGSHAD